MLSLLVDQSSPRKTIRISTVSRVVDDSRRMSIWVCQSVREMDKKLGSNTAHKKPDAEAQARALFEQELSIPRGLRELSYEKLRKNGRCSGYAAFYMFKKRDAKTLTTSANLDTMMKFAQLDRVLGSTIPEMIFDCCLHAPKKEFISKLISLDTTSDKSTVVKNVLNYTEENGSNCLIQCFGMAIDYANENDASPKPTTGMMTEIEDTILFLIVMGELNNVDMNRVLNHTAKNGTTLFDSASRYSENTFTRPPRQCENCDRSFFDAWFWSK